MPQAVTKAQAGRSYLHGVALNAARPFAYRTRTAGLLGMSAGYFKASRLPYFLNMQYLNYPAASLSNEPLHPSTASVFTEQPDVLLRKQAEPDAPFSRQPAFRHLEPEPSRQQSHVTMPEVVTPAERNIVRTLPVADPSMQKDTVQAGPYALQPAPALERHRGEPLAPRTSSSPAVQVGEKSHDDAPATADAQSMHRLKMGLSELSRQLEAHNFPKSARGMTNKPSNEVASEPADAVAPLDTPVAPKRTAVQIPGEHKQTSPRSDHYQPQNQNDDVSKQETQTLTRGERQHRKHIIASMQQALTEIPEDKHLRSDAASSPTPSFKYRQPPVNKYERDASDERLYRETVKAETVSQKAGSKSQPKLKPVQRYGTPYRATRKFKNQAAFWERSYLSRLALRIYK